MVSWDPRTKVHKIWEISVNWPDPYIPILRAGTQPTLDPYAKSLLYQAHCINPGGEESGSSIGS